MHTIHTYLHRYPHLFSPADYTYARWAWACSIIMSRTWVMHTHTHTHTHTHIASSCHEHGHLFSKVLFIVILVDIRVFFLFLLRKHFITKWAGGMGRWVGCGMGVCVCVCVFVRVCVGRWVGCGMGGRKSLLGFWVNLIPTRGKYRL
jgi:hypothetical protein